MNNKAINELGFRRIWRIKQICLILHILRKPNSLIAISSSAHRWKQTWFGINYYTYASRSLMHPHRDHSYEHPMDGAGKSRGKFHFPDTEHRPAKFYHFLGRNEQMTEPVQQKDTLVDDRQLAHLLNPMNRHKPFPRYPYNWSPLCPLRTNFLQPISNLHVTHIKI